MSEPERRYLVVGQIRKPWGYRGEVQVQVLTDFPKRLIKFKTLYLGPETRAVQVEHARLHSDSAIFKFAGIDSPEEAARLRGQVMQIPIEEAAELKAGQYYHHQIIGLTVVRTDGRELGSIEEILETGANDIYVVRRMDGGELLLPAIHDVIREIDLENRRMTVELLPGLGE